MKSQAAPEKRPARGRRPAGSGTRDAILAAARDQFGESGYQKTTIRSVARAAGVDPRLVLHYFGSKQQLFVESVRLPGGSEDRLAAAFAGASEVGDPGRIMAEAVVDLIEDPEMRPMIVGLVRAAASEQEAAALIREALIQTRLGPMAAAMSGDHSELRASFVASQVVGLVMARHITQIAPLATASPEQLVVALAPVFAHYLTGDWTQEATADG